MDLRFVIFGWLMSNKAMIVNRALDVSEIVKPSAKMPAHCGVVWMHVMLMLPSRNHGKLALGVLGTWGIDVAPPCNTILGVASSSSQTASSNFAQPKFIVLRRLVWLPAGVASCNFARVASGACRARARQKEHNGRTASQKSNTGRVSSRCAYSIAFLSASAAL